MTFENEKKTTCSCGLRKEKEAGVGWKTPVNLKAQLESGQGGFNFKFLMSVTV